MSDLERLLTVAGNLEFSKEHLTSAYNNHKDVLDYEVQQAITDGLAAVSRGLRVLDPFLGHAVRQERRP